MREVLYAEVAAATLRLFAGEPENEGFYALTNWARGGSRTDNAGIYKQIAFVVYCCMRVFLPGVHAYARPPI